MLKLSSFQKYILIILVALFSSCTENEEAEIIEPANLTVEITQSDEEFGLITIDAQAENTVEYHFFVSTELEPIEINTSGTFQYVFAKAGAYQIEIRAYGTSGRYVKVDRQIIIESRAEVLPEDGYTSPLSYDGYNLVWYDEFDGSEVNTNDWNFEIGTGSSGWGNNELEYYRKENAWLDDGILTIEARQEAYSGSNYTSTRMTTQGKQSFKYARIDIRALLPEGQGIWPALWMLGTNISSVGWPACGEIDIMEMIGGSGRENTTHGTIHWYNAGWTYTGDSNTLASGTFADKYHVFSIVWDETKIQWYVDNIKFHEIDITPAHMTEFHATHFFIFNVAVGGNWPGSPNATTVFPQRMKVDYIRVFQQN